MKRGQGMCERHEPGVRGGVGTLSCVVKLESGGRSQMRKEDTKTAYTFTLYEDVKQSFSYIPVEWYYGDNYTVRA